MSQGEDGNSISHRSFGLYQMSGKPTNQRALQLGAVSDLPRLQKQLVWTPGVGWLQDRVNFTADEKGDADQVQP